MMKRTVIGIKKDIFEYYSKGKSINDLFHLLAKHEYRLTKSEKKALKVAYENKENFSAFKKFLNIVDFNKAKQAYAEHKGKKNNKTKRKINPGPSFNVERYLLEKQSTEIPLDDDLDLDDDFALSMSSNDLYETIDTPNKETAATQVKHNLPLHLYVFDPEDVTELTLEEVELVWHHRLKLCGTKEAAAEILAIKNVNDGNIKNYKGWESYLNHDLISEFERKLKDIELAENPQNDQIITINPFHRKKYNRSEVVQLPLKRILKLWEERNYSFSSISAACEALAIIRKSTKIDSQKKHWKAFLEHPQILDLDFDIDEEDTDKLIENVHIKIDDKEQVSLHALTEDNRDRVTRSQVTRVGQQGFRSLTLDNFYSKCAVSGCAELALLEAAHIIPYKGEQSNLLQNGLCLRVDIHRLFDRFLISIEPQTLKIVVSDKVRDKYYRGLKGNSLGQSKSNISKSLLKKHFYQFTKANTR